MALRFLHIIFSISLVAQEYYSFMVPCRCKEHEIKHICRYHSRQKIEVESCKGETRKGSKDIYIEVSPGTYSITATSEDMVRQTHVVDVSAGQSVDLTFVL
ncbi:AKIP1 protein, partial [Turnix velox]|nr:AKIP1 protein [Turnix velox]